MLLLHVCRPLAQLLLPLQSARCHRGCSCLLLPALLHCTSPEHTAALLLHCLPWEQTLLLLLLLIQKLMASLRQLLLLLQPQQLHGPAALV